MLIVLGTTTGCRFHEPVWNGNSSLCPVRIYPATDQGRIRYLRVRWVRSDGCDYRCLRGTYDRPGYQPVVDQSRSSDTDSKPARPGCRPWDLQPPRERALSGPAGLVWRGDAGRGSWSRHG